MDVSNFDKTMDYPEGYDPYEIVGKCECGGDITRGEKDAAGICTTCYFERMPDE